MARRGSVAVTQAPTWTDIFRASDVGGTDGGGLRGALLSVPSGAASAMEYRIEDPADPGATGATIQPGNSIQLTGGTRLIKHIRGRGATDATTAHIHENHL